MTRGLLKGVLAGATTLALAGCLGNTTESVARLDDPGGALLARPTPNDAALNSGSEVIQGLYLRQSVLSDGGSYDTVVSSVLAANSRVAEAELRAARLRAEAASKNWLPTIGPRISLNSLGDVVSQILLEQVVFDNGRKKGERAFAAADVEVAAVALSEDTNTRAAIALELYLEAAEGRETAALHQATLTEMEHFAWVMRRRVEGGVSDRSDLNVLEQKLSEIRAGVRASEERTRTALAELNAMSIQPLDSVRGAGRLDVSETLAEPLSVTRAKAEKTRAIAAANIDRANQLPGATLVATAGDNSGVGANVSGQLGLGTGASLQASAAAKETAERRVAQASEDAQRTLKKFASELAALERQAGEAHKLTEQARANLTLFKRQYDGGQRQIMDVVGVYETFAARNVSEVSLKYEALRKAVELARVQGALADGSAI